MKLLLTKLLTKCIFYVFVCLSVCVSIHLSIYIYTYWPCVFWQHKLILLELIYFCISWRFGINEFNVSTSTSCADFLIKCTLIWHCLLRTNRNSDPFLMVLYFPDISSASKEKKRILQGKKISTVYLLKYIPRDLKYKKKKNSKFSSWGIQNSKLPGAGTIRDFICTWCLAQWNPSFWLQPLSTTVIEIINDDNNNKVHLLSWQAIFEIMSHQGN